MKRWQQIGSVLLVCCLVVGILPMRVFATAESEETAAETTVIWDGTIADAYAGGSGTEKAPYLIKTAEQLARISEQVNSGEESGKYYMLSCDIYLNDVSSVDLWEDVAPQNEWTPIGNAETAFSGNFDGNGYTIYGLYISTEEDYQGLFGIAGSSTIKNIGVEDSYIKGGSYVGAICGERNSESGGSEQVIDCYSSAYVTGTDYVGGILGYYAGIGTLFGKAPLTMQSCYNTGTVSGENYIGGIVGQGDFCYFSKCYNAGTIHGEKTVGGIAGSGLTSSYCWNAGKITGTTYVGGVFGEGSHYYSTSSSLSNSFNAGAVSGTSYVGGILGYSTVYSGFYPSTISNCYNVGAITGVAGGNYVGGIAGQGNVCTYKNCYNAGNCTLGDGANVGAVFNYGAREGSTNLYYREGCCGESYTNNWSNCVTEKSILEMCDSTFVDALNNGGSAWLQDTEEYNSGYPILSGIDYTVFASYCEVHPLDLYCKIVVLDSITFQPIDWVQAIDAGSNTMVDYTGSDGIILLRDSALKFLSDMSLTFSKDGYQSFTCSYSDLETDAQSYQSVNYIYLTPEGEDTDQSEEKFFIGEHVYFIENEYDDIIANNGFYDIVWANEGGNHLWTYYLWEGIGDVLEFCEFKFDDLTISVDFFDVYMSDLILELTENELDDRLYAEAGNAYEETYKNVKDNIVTAFIEYWAGEDKDETYKEIWENASIVGEKMNKLIKGEPYEMSETEKVLYDAFFQKLIADEELYASIFEGAAAVETLSSYYTDLSESIGNVMDAYILAKSACEVNEEVFEILFSAVEKMESYNKAYAAWFKKNVSKYYALATDPAYFMIDMVKEGAQELATLMYNTGYRKAIQKCAYKFTADALGIASADLKVLVESAKWTYKFMDWLTNNSGTTEQYAIMNYIAYVEKALESVVQEKGEYTVQNQTYENALSYDLAYSLLQHTNKYLYNSLYDYMTLSNLAHNDMGAYYATAYKNTWNLARCHGNVVVNRSKYISVECPVDVYLYRADGELVLSIVDENIVEYKDSEITVMICDEQKAIMYPADTDYEIKIVAREAGIMDYSVIEVEGMEPSRYVEFYDLPLSSEQEYVGSIPSAFGIENTVYALETDGATVLRDYDSDDSKECDSNGHSYGEWRIVVEPTNETYGVKKRVCSRCGKTETEAVQRKEALTNYSITFDANRGVVDTDTVLTEANGKLSSLPTPTRDGYTFTGWYTATEGGVQITTDTVFTADTTVYAQWTFAGSGAGVNQNSGSSGKHAITVSSTPNGTVTINPTSAREGTTVTITVIPDDGYEIESLTLTEASGKTLDLTEKGDGQYTFAMPASKVTVTAHFVVLEEEPGLVVNPFADVFERDYYYDAVLWAVENGVTYGTSTTTFSPDAGCTRAQMVTFLWRAAGSPAVSSTVENPFVDVSTGTYYYDAVLWAAEEGITLGTSATTFAPDETVTRGQTVTFLYRFAGSPAVVGDSSFSDVDEGAYYASAVQWAEEEGITNGTSTTTFGPEENCTRGQIVTFLYRAAL